LRRCWLVLDLQVDARAYPLWRGSNIQALLSPRRLSEYVGHAREDTQRADRPQAGAPMVETEALHGATDASVAPHAPIDPTALGEVAIVHDYINQRGGAERVVLELARIWPQATIYTSLYRPGSTFPEFREHVIRTSPLDRLPVDGAFRALFPLYPAAFRSLGRIDADLVISSSSGWAHMVRTSPRALHVVYCYTPARWLYRDDYLVADRSRSWSETMVTPILGAMRRMDRRAARRADLYIGISREVQQRIADVYGRESEVVYPPVDISRFAPRPRGERLLTIARLLPYKRVDLVIRAADRLGLGLDIVGDGPALDALRAIASDRVTFHRSVSEVELIELLEGCRAVCVAGEEDFGIVPVEAQAAGKPVVAYAAGGALETITPGVTGVLFDEQTEDSLVAAIAACEEVETAPEAIAEYAERFSSEAFERNLLAAIARRSDR
jgi:glycosyltransferase involved in cell wall biosynthesis